MNCSLIYFLMLASESYCFSCSHPSDLTTNASDLVTGEPCRVLRWLVRVHVKRSDCQCYIGIESAQAQPDFCLRFFLQCLAQFDPHSPSPSPSPPQVSSHGAAALHTPIFQFDVVENSSTPPASIAYVPEFNRMFQTALVLNLYASSSDFRPCVQYLRQQSTQSFLFGVWVHPLASALALSRQFCGQLDCQAY